MDNVLPVRSPIVMSAILLTPAEPVLIPTSIKITYVKLAIPIVKIVRVMLGLALNARLANFFMLDNVSHAEQTVMNVQS
jgi:hypothetical protein